MAIVRSKRRAIALVITCTVVVNLFWVYHANNLARVSVETIDYMKLHVNKINVVLPASLNSRSEKIYCRKITLTDMRFPICHFNSDEYISSFLLHGRYYEGKQVDSLLQLLRLDRKLHLVDIGANLGVYSLPAARFTRVIAVEPNWRSMLRLAKAVNLGGVNSNITLVHNAIYSVRTTLSMSVDPVNEGQAILVKTTQCNLTPNENPCDTSLSVRTILLNDLLPLMRSKSALIKVDVVGHEVDVFTNATAGQFFDEVDVPVVMMEWFRCKRRSTHLIKRLLNFFYSRNYAAFSLRNSKLEKHYSRWPYDIMFKKVNRSSGVYPPQQANRYSPQLPPFPIPSPFTPFLSLSPPPSPSVHSPPAANPPP